MNDKIKSINANDFKFKFKIDGKLDKDIATSEEITLNRNFELAEVDAKASCTFTIGQKKVASLSCNLSVENYKKVNQFSFKASEIMTDDNQNEIYLSKFNDITLINSKEEKVDDDNDNKTVIIAVSTVCSVLVAVGIGIGIFFLIKKLRMNKVNNNNEDKISENNKKVQEPLASERSGQKVIEFKTMTNV